MRGTTVSAAALEAGQLALVVRAGAGYNTIDVAAASRRGIYVSNCPGRNAIAVAELTFALILALDRRVPDNVAELRAGRWNKKEYSKARGLFGRTLGLIGYGQHRRGSGAPRGRHSGCRSSSGAGVLPDGRRGRAGVPISRRSITRAARRGVGRRQRASRADAGDPRLRRRGVSRSAAAGLVLHQHRARRSRRPRRARATRPASGASASDSTYSPASQLRQRATSATRWSRCRASTAPTTSAARPTRRRKRSPPKRCASCLPT